MRTDVPLLHAEREQPELPGRRGDAATLSACGAQHAGVAGFVVTIETIESTYLTRVGLFMLGLGSLLEQLQASFRLQLCTAERGGAAAPADDGAGAGDRKQVDREAAVAGEADGPSAAPLHFDLTLSGQPSHLLVLWVRARMSAYTGRWLGILRFLRDLFGALHDDIQAVDA